MSVESFITKVKEAQITGTPKLTEVKEGDEIVFQGTVDHKFRNGETEERGKFVVGKKVYPLGEFAVAAMNITTKDKLDLEWTDQIAESDDVIKFQKWMTEDDANMLSTGMKFKCIGTLKVKNDFTGDPVLSETSYEGYPAFKVQRREIFSQNLRGQDLMNKFQPIRDALIQTPVKESSYLNDEKRQVRIPVFQVVK